MIEEEKIDEIDEKLDKTENDETIINLLYQKVDLLEEIIGKNKNLIQKQQEEIEKKDKIIDEMANYIYSVDYRSECGNSRKQIKQYFESKV